MFIRWKKCHYGYSVMCIITVVALSIITISYAWFRGVFWHRQFSNSITELFQYRYPNPGLCVSRTIFPFKILYSAQCLCSYISLLIHLKDIPYAQDFLSKKYRKTYYDLRYSYGRTDSNRNYSITAFQFHEYSGGRHIE